MSGQLQPIVNNLTRAEWTKRISGDWRETFEAVIRTGRDLILAKEELAHGEFGRMIESDLPFGGRTARMLMTIARSPQITNRNHGSALPTHWRTLYALTKFTAPEFEHGVAEGLIHADTERADVQRLVQWLRDAGLRPASLDNLEPGKFSILYADPPWLYNNQGTRAAMGNHYRGLTPAQIASDIPVEALPPPKPPPTYIFPATAATATSERAEGICAPVVHCPRSWPNATGSGANVRTAITAACLVGLLPSIVGPHGLVSTGISRMTTRGHR